VKYINYSFAAITTTKCRAFERHPELGVFVMFMYTRIMALYNTNVLMKRIIKTQVTFHNSLQHHRYTADFETVACTDFGQYIDLVVLQLSRRLCQLVRSQNVQRWSFD
jgi:hypothetical protein